jgi:hypothetical protein
VGKGIHLWERWTLRDEIQNPGICLTGSGGEWKLEKVFCHEFLRPTTEENRKWS